MTSQPQRRPLKRKTRPSPKNVQAALQAASLYGKGMMDAGYELLKNCRKVDLLEAARIMEVRAEFAKQHTRLLERVDTVVRRHTFEKGATIEQILDKAAKTGDAEAQALLDEGVLDMPFAFQEMSP